MTENELLTYLRKEYPIEKENCEWKEMKNLKNSFANDEKKDVISYVSGISNMDGGELIIGVKDKLKEIVGTDLSNFNFNYISVKFRLIEMCPNLPSTGLDVEEFITSDTGKVVWIIHIPKHLPRKPVWAHKKKYQRIGDVLTELSKEREDEILTEEINSEDWSAATVDNATIEDLDPIAIEKAMQGFCERYPEYKEESENWDVLTFLDKARITINGKITRTALLLLGKPESAYLLGHPAELLWKLQTKDEKASQIFFPPFLLTAILLREKVRNYQIKIFPNNALLPAEIWKYDSRTILEALHNCIMHQDYSMGERVVVNEYADKLTFTNAGSFYDGKSEDYIEGRKTPTKYRNHFLALAMSNLKMVDRLGYGIHEMYQRQKDRYLPMPDYENQDRHVFLELPGQVINKEYSELLMENSNIDLLTALLLDRVQKRKIITKEQAKKLRSEKLIEGIYPNLIISRSVARMSHREAEYTNLSGLDDTTNQEFILKALKDHGRLKRNVLNDILYKRFPEKLDESQKNNKMDYLLKKLKRDNKIHFENGYWKLI